MLTEPESPCGKKLSIDTPYAAGPESYPHPEGHLHPVICYSGATVTVLTCRVPLVGRISNAGKFPGMKKPRQVIPPGQSPRLSLGS